MKPGRIEAVIAQRCPVCLKGSMFHGIITMYDNCQVCGHRFMRESGYFQGAMYVSYVMGLGTFMVLLLLCRAKLGPQIGLGAASAVAIIFQLMLVPVLFRYSRTIWAHLNVGTTG
ncbi:MAG TPA: DUF983 domain-containing protein [Gemmatimonadales bacterium]|jgi:uncharacterized protein (DUF983 family)